MKPVIYSIYESLDVIEKVNFLINYFQNVKDGNDQIDPKLIDQFIDMTFENDDALNDLFGFLKDRKNFTKNQANSIIDSMKARGFRYDMIKFLAAHNGPESGRLYFSQLCKNSGRGNLIDVISTKYNISPVFVEAVCKNTTKAKVSVGVGEMAVAIFCNDGAFDASSENSDLGKADIQIIGKRSKKIEMKCGTWRPSGMSADYNPNVSDAKIFINNWLKRFEAPSISLSGRINLYDASNHAKDTDIAKAIIDLSPDLFGKIVHKAIKPIKLSTCVYKYKHRYNNDQGINKALLAIAILCYKESENFDGIFMLCKTGSKANRSAYDYMYIDNFDVESIFELVFSCDDNSSAVTNIDLGSNMSCIPKMNANNYLNKN